MVLIIIIMIVITVTIHPRVPEVGGHGIPQKPKGSRDMVRVCYQGCTHEQQELHKTVHKENAIYGH